MNIYNSNTHHRKSIRLKGYDYSQAGLYFITICTEGRKCLFGKIILTTDNDVVENLQPRQEMILNDAGKIANECWLQIPEHFPNVILREHIIMPNHIHGIVELIKSVSSNIGAGNFLPQHSQKSVGVEYIQHLRNEFQKIIPYSIGSIVRGFKIGVTKWFRNYTEIENIWQRNYYEHVIRNKQSYVRIADYIINNPKNWKNDDFFNCK